jgi:hypothetical protein
LVLLHRKRRGRRPERDTPADVTSGARFGAGQAPGPRRPVHGADRVARFFAATAAGTTVRLVEAGGGPAAPTLLDGVPYAVLVLDLAPDDQRGTVIRVVADPAEPIGVLGRTPGFSGADSDPHSM